MPKPTGIYQLYNGAIAAAREQGQTLQEIGDTFGVSRERIRQVLAQYFRDAKIIGLSPSEVCDILGCTLYVLRRLRKKGVVKGILHGKNSWRYTLEAVRAALSFYMRPCPYCKKGLQTYSMDRKYCDRVCQRHMHAYRNKTEEKKAVQKASTRNWGRAHPEQLKRIQSNATRRYVRKLSQELWASNPKYRVTRNCQLPIGTIVTGVGHAKDECRLITDAGLRISYWNLKREVAI